MDNRGRDKNENTARPNGRTRGVLFVSKTRVILGVPWRPSASLGLGLVLDRPVKELGLHPVRVVLHPEVAATISVNVARSEEEARLQATGRSIQDVRAEEDTAAEFEIAELFDDIGSAADVEGVEGVEGESTLVEEPKAE